MATSSPPARRPGLLARLLARKSDGRQETLVGPIRGELLGADRLGEHARALARRQRVRPPGKGRKKAPLLERLHETHQILLDARDTLGQAADEGIDVSPAGEWLLDNFYTVEEHIREIRETLPRGYYRELPELASGPLARFPRVYEIAIELIANTEGHLDLANTELFVREYQRVTRLRIGELWAIPAMLRLGLIENIRRMTRRTVSRLDEVRAADAAAETLRRASEAGPKALAAALHDFVDHTPKLSAVFIARFLSQVRNYQATFTPLVWLEQWIGEDLMSAEEAVARTNQRAALTRVTIANSITSLRTIARLDWNSFVESQSAIERVLRGDPSGDYASMTFSARDRYRHEIERLAKRTERDEAKVAEVAIELASRQPADGPESRRRHVGYWLVDDGLAELEAAVAYKPRPLERLRRAATRHPNAVYFPAIAIVTLAALAAGFALAGPIGAGGAVIVFLLGIVPASEIGVSAVNQLVTLLTQPRLVPKMDFRERGIPPEWRTAVVVPTLIGSVDAAREAVEHLEVQFLANRDPQLHFALLTDFVDAPSETMPDDAAILDAAADGIAALNEKYARGSAPPFYLFHRPRRWNEGEGVWMGWERKRGKLAEFNQYLRGGARDAFSRIVGDTTPLGDVKLVITLDSDTVLPPDAAQLLVGAMAHPLNRPVFDAERGLITKGYGILQPRVGVSLTSSYRSRFASIHSGHPGVDPYTTAVSDVYQDLFGEGSYTGKGIYDVDAFERATRGRFAENVLLSHDLIEGAFARAGLVTDIELYDDYPTRYLTYMRRKHRWIRGDWQILRWIGPAVPRADGRPEPNRLSAISRWKIFDNLRRSTVEIFQLLLLVAGWTVLPASRVAWTAAILVAIAFPWLLSLTLAALRPPIDKSLRAYYSAIGRDVVTSANQFALAVTVLPHQAWVSADAIVRTLTRLFVSRRHLLEWQTASQTERTTKNSLREVWRRMLPAELVTLAIAAFVLLSVWQLTPREISIGRAHGPTLVVVLPFILLWLISPLIAHALSAPALRRELRLASDDRDRAMRYAVYHWRFFERFVGEGTQWLAPDNFQEQPEPVVALRTSPTNIGLQLLGITSAYDLGLLTLGEMIERLEHVFKTLERMRRHRGHFFNWYELEGLSVLQPAYISTVDSGNLAGHFVALKQACREIIENPPDVRAPLRALTSALAITREAFADAASSGRVGDPAKWQAVSKAAGLLKTARSELATTTDDAGLAHVARALAEADEALSAAGLGPKEAPQAREWLAWSAHLAERHVAERTGLGTAATQSLRDAAATSALAGERIERLEAIALTAHRYVVEMDFTFLYDARRKLFAIGYSADSGTLDNSYYDLLASEARLASYVAIAKDDVPVEHWFRLGRSLTASSHATALVSWSGSMFEYLMPLLVMRSFPHTLLDQTYRGAVRRQIEYAAERSVPWGISESAYNVRDRHMTYQYRAFGVPDLALKRGLGKDLVIAPYATALALLVEPHEAIRNLGVLEREGVLGPYGFREAVDYTRPEPGETKAIVGAYMAHHVGMTFVALANALADNLWQRRFHSEPLARAVELVLHERIPRRLVMQDAQETEGEGGRTPIETEKPAVRQIETPDTPQPRVGLLASLPFTVMLSNAGAGYSRYEQLAITRWRADGTRDDHGQWCYVRDVTTDRVWSVTHQPTGKRADAYTAAFATDRISFGRRDGDVETRLDVTVVSDDMAEVRRVTLVNHSGVEREIELTSYGEIVLAPPDADRAHPAFANLFVETEWRPAEAAILATRRPRSSNEARRWLAHVAAVGHELVGDITCETDRARFVGRGRTVRNPLAMEGSSTLSGTAGAVLDPIFALRVRVRLAPGQSARVAFTTLVAETRERAIELADLYRQPYSAQRALDLSWTRTQVELRDLGLTPSDAALFQQIAGHLFYSNPPMRAPQQELRANTMGQRELWSIGLSGDWPILLATIDSVEGLPTVRQLLHAHQYWRLKGMTVDLVFLVTRPPSYQQELADQLLATVMGSSETHLADKPGGVFIRRADVLGPEPLKLLRATARVHIACDGLGLGRVLDMPEVEEQPPDELERPRRLSRFSNRDSGFASWDTGGRGEDGSEGVMSAVLSRAAAYARDAALDLAESFELPEFRIGGKGNGDAENRGNREPGTGTARGNTVPGSRFPVPSHGLTSNLDYEINLTADALPPAPWANVIANPEAGFVITERGGGFTWVENSYFFRLTPWYNDPVSDPPTELLYVRDESGVLWSPTPAIAGDRSSYRVRHGAGFTTFTHERDGIGSELTLSMPPKDPVKITRLRLVNRTDRSASLVLTSFVELALGVMREHTQHQIVTSFDRETQAIFASNCFDASFADRVAFSWISEPLACYTADRREFIGRNGDLTNPAALAHDAPLAETTGAAVDPCAALQVNLTLKPNETRDVIVLLGAARGQDAARQLIARYGSSGAANAAIDAMADDWSRRLSTITVKTPEPLFDAMMNRWSLYQALSCRMWARSAFYQSSGAYGFRDQLQDVMAFVYHDQAIAREHILHAASRQFVEGDVQHWWHPHTGRGTRTRFSDDLVWLPYVVDHYVRITGDDAVLDEVVPFLQMRPLEPHEHEVYDLPTVADETGSLYEHCLRALRHACTFGAHGLPLIGVGDWNDGMNRVGIEGKGESVWLAWFLNDTLRAFADHCDSRGDGVAAGELRVHADAYARAANEAGWDGAWYRRAYFDDGAPLGSAESDECKIDSIAQSWSVISAAGEVDKRERAMESLDQWLVREDARLIMLLTPPFDKTSHDPGYIKGYLPGVRENGAQYTHAALWAVLATALKSDGDRAFHLYQMINPLTHAVTPEDVQRYKVEPYVVAADVYTAAGHLGRGGWTWYTGSASWMYRIGLENILGFTKQGDTLTIEPCIPQTWREFSLEYRHGSAIYAIRVTRSGKGGEILRVIVDGGERGDRTISLDDDGRRHEVTVELG
ncbi:MAG TPA: glucoamylase family protein [Gemmatimonadaceae bacterium]|nr:glucoamylase family protein [Gemmatimonadaceae bacterium]